MLEQKISRNDPCPCGSGRKFKKCCMGKDIDWSAKKTRRLPPARVSKPTAFSFGQFAVVDAKLKTIASEHPTPGEWKSLVERLSDATSEEDRMVKGVACKWRITEHFYELLTDVGSETLVEKDRGEASFVVIQDFKKGTGDHRTPVPWPVRAEKEREWLSWALEQLENYSLAA